MTQGREDRSRHDVVAGRVVERAEERAGLGWISVNAPVPLQIFEDSRLLGTSEQPLMVSVGRDQLVLVNQVVGFSQSQAVNVTPGRVTPISHSGRAR